MRTLLNSCKYIIVLCLLGAGVLIAGSSHEIIYNGGNPGVEIQNGQNSNIQEVSMVPQSLDHINIILVLLCTGLIGFIGVRRHGHTFKDYVRAEHPQQKFDEDIG
jgi:hypothetical protein